jgi:hypothetical protein
MQPTLLARLREWFRNREQTAVVYFHSPCFDGIVSAVLTWDFAEAVLGWKVGELRPVNYQRRSSWLSERLSQPSAVVDFLYHPQAMFWADHHSTTFLSAEAERDFEQRGSPYLIYDDTADACAQLLWDRLERDFQYRNPRYAELVSWATKTDAARYASVWEAIEGTAPALKINGSLAYGDENGYSAWLVRQLRREPLEAVANLREVRRRYERFRFDAAKGLELFRERARLDGGVVVFDVDADDTIVPRYAPYYFFPEARYSAGVVRRGGSTTITAMRNPWRDFSGVHLGKILEPLGGGGHERVGSVVLRGVDTSRAEMVLDQLLNVLREVRSRRVSGSHSR